MRKEQFIEELKVKLRGLPKEDIEDRLSFYSEMIDDRVEDGLSEEEAIQEIGTSDEIASKVIESTSLTKIVKEKVRLKRKLEAWEIVLIILGFPLWFPLLVMVLTFILVFTILLWSAVIVLWSVEGSLIVGAFSFLIESVIILFSGTFAASVATLGVSLLSAGVAIFLFYACAKVTELTAKLTRKIILSIKKALVGGES
ncbi:MAG: DUF1700 domain-containing protein [Acholeplasmataceae bacterium]|jgi:uncharacterized membrane protein|nr:DUF1700 domain-containing protein [Acholeplasmataceae bacterium]